MKKFDLKKFYDQIDLPQKKCDEIIENYSDGYHTFKELYDHRITLFIALCRKLSCLEKASNCADDYYDVWRSKKNSKLHIIYHLIVGVKLNLPTHLIKLLNLTDTLQNMFWKD